MMRTLTMLVVAPLLALALFSSPAQASFGLNDFDVTFTEADGSPDAQAGSHPFAMTTSFNANTVEEGTEIYPDQAPKDVIVKVPPGFVPDPSAVPRCSGAEFADINLQLVLPGCSNSTAVGVISVRFAIAKGLKPGEATLPLYNLAPAPGTALKLGFVIENVPVVIEGTLRDSYPYEGVARSTNITQSVSFFGARVTLWGDPADPAHDPERGSCVNVTVPPKVPGEVVSRGKCPVAISNRPFFTMPRSCQGPLLTAYASDSWQHPGARLPDGEPDLVDPNWVTGGAESHDASEPPSPLGMQGCSKLGFSPAIVAKATTKAAESPTGLDFSLDVSDEGLTNPTGLADSDIRKAVVTLPKGMTANPSAAEGLGVCTEANLERETLQAAPGEGCPDASKLGTIEVQTPLLEEDVDGSLYLAKPYENPFHSLIALYMVIENRNLGVIVKQPVKVEPDPRTGQLVSTVENIPQLPFSHFELHFREGARSPLVSPPTCGLFNAEAKLYPWSGGEPLTTTSAFEIASGTGESPCPSGSTPPFHPGFEAGSINNDAGSYSPFYMRLTRRDGDQDLTKFSAKLPPGMVAKLAGASECPAADIAQARSRTGAHGGEEELADPSCPASSQIGRVLAGAGVGSILTYVPGKLYLAGPLNGAPISVVAIVPAVAGPFDVGVVVTQVALRIDPRTAEVTADGSSSDPIPHILAGIPLKVRDIRVYVDRPQFTLNPTSCEPFATDATLWGGGADVFSSADDVPLALASRFQAANCASLGFKPRLDLKLLGGTRRGAFPKLRLAYTPRPGDANLSDLVLRFPHSEFIEQGHFRTICTRVQFAAGAGFGQQCPAGSVYGHVRVFTPLLAEPLEGVVYLRSSSHNLPDVVLALHGPPSLPIDVEVPTRIDSSHGGLRASAEATPDVPISEVVLEMQGAQKGLFVNSTDLCRGVHRAHVNMSGQNGKAYSFKPVVKVSCGKERKRHGHRAPGHG